MDNSCSVKYFWQINPGERFVWYNREYIKLAENPFAPNCAIDTDGGEIEKFDEQDKVVFILRSY